MMVRFLKAISPVRVESWLRTSVTNLFSTCSCESSFVGVAVAEFGNMVFGFYCYLYYDGIVYHQDWVCQTGVVTLLVSSASQAAKQRAITLSVGIRLSSSL